jgi:hypothetical protein
MAQDRRASGDGFSQLWQRHLHLLRDDFSITSVQALPSLPSRTGSLDDESAGDGAADDEECSRSRGKRANLEGDALEELTLSLSVPPSSPILNLKV